MPILKQLLCFIALIALIMKSNLALANLGISELGATSLNGDPQTVDISPVNLISEDLSLEITSWETYKVKAKYRLDGTKLKKETKVSFFLPLTNYFFDASHWTKEPAGSDYLSEDLQKLYFRSKYSPFKDSEDRKESLTKEDEEKVHEALYPFEPKTMAKNLTKALATLKIEINGQSVSCNVDLVEGASARWNTWRKECGVSFSGNCDFNKWWPKDSFPYRCNGVLKIEPKRINEINFSYVGSFEYVSESTDEEYDSLGFRSVSDRELVYHLWPAAKWGNGKVQDLTVKISNSMEPGISAIGLPFRKDRDGNYFYYGKNVDFSKYRTIQMKIPAHLPNADLSVALFSKSALSVAAYSVKPKLSASSTLKQSSSLNYSTENLLDGKLETAWCEGAPGPGKGQWLVLDFSKARVVDSANIINFDYRNLKSIKMTVGYAKSRQVFLQNTRPKVFNISTCSNKVLDTYEVSRADLDYFKSNINVQIFPNAPPTDFDGCIKISFDQVEKGTSEDLCLSEVRGVYTNR